MLAFPAYLNLLYYISKSALICIIIIAIQPLATLVSSFPLLSISITKTFLFKVALARYCPNFLTREFLITIIVTSNSLAPKFSYCHQVTRSIKTVSNIHQSLFLSLIHYRVFHLNKHRLNIKDMEPNTISDLYKGKVVFQGIFSKLLQIIKSISIIT